jgi:hypothetical protein
MALMALIAPLYIGCGQALMKTPCGYTGSHQWISMTNIDISPACKYTKMQMNDNMPFRKASTLQCWQYHLSRFGAH